MARKPLKLSRYQLDMAQKCPRCFWLLKRHGIKQPKTFPMALNIAMDYLLKEEFDAFRRKGEQHPLLLEHAIPAKLFDDWEKLALWRNNFRGVSWTDPETQAVLFGAVDDILEYPDGSLAVLDYKSSGAREAHIYPDYQFQVDVYTFLLQQNGYTTAPQAFFAYFLAVKDRGFDGRLPFRRELLSVRPNPEPVAQKFRDAVALAQADAAPDPGEGCDNCRWYQESHRVTASQCKARPEKPGEQYTFFE